MFVRKREFFQISRGSYQSATSPHLSPMRPSVYVPKSDRPRSWDLLTAEDQRQYERLRQDLQPLSSHIRRRDLGRVFGGVINQIHSYAIHNDPDDWKRCLACGLVWLDPNADSAFAVRTSQLCVLTTRGRSSLNVCFQALGYAVTPLSVSHGASFVKIFPFMRTYPNQMREWTVRTKIPVVAQDDQVAIDPFESAALEWDPFVVMPEAWIGFF
jgi:hypothetical protein